MRVLAVGNLYPPHHFGGYERVWRSATAHLREHGHDVEILATGYRHEGVEDGDEPGVHRDLRWYWRDHGFPNLPPRERLEIERHNHAVLSRRLRDFTPDVVSFWSMGGMSHGLIEHVRRRGLPIVSFVHDEWVDYGRRFDGWQRLFAGRRRALAPLAERRWGVPAHVDYAGAGRYVFVSEHVRRRAQALGLGLRDTAVAPSGIDPGLLRDDAATAQRPWRWRLLHLGRLHPDKGIHDAAAALADLPEEATLTFAGSWDPRDEAALARRAHALGVAGRIRMLGQVEHDAVAGLLAEHDALLFPVIWDEPWGLVPLEAMAAGCPVVATGRGGSAEYLRDGENCLLAPAQDPPALAAAVTRLAADPALRARLRAGGAATAPHHTEPVFAAAVERHLAAAVA